MGSFISIIVTTTSTATTTTTTAPTTTTTTTTAAAAAAAAKTAPAHEKLAPYLEGLRPKCPLSFCGGVFFFADTGVRRTRKDTGQGRGLASGGRWAVFEPCRFSLRVQACPVRVG